MATPQWNARRNGLMGDASAMANANDLNQLLGTHAQTYVYPGNSILVPTGNGGTIWGQQLLTQDVSQPFTMSGTTIGRVAIPVLPVGNGADLLVSLCSNSSGLPGSMITQTRIPASWIYETAGAVGIPGSAGAGLISPSTIRANNPLATAQFNVLFTSALSPGAWPLPAGTDGSYVTGWASAATDTYLVLLGGLSNSTNAAQPSAYTVAISGGVMSAAVPQPAMPTANFNGGATIVTDPSSGIQTAFLAGGWAATTTGSPALTRVYGAQLNSSNGTLSSWTAQTALPTATSQPAVVSCNGYLYVIGGVNGAYLSGGTALSTVQYAQVSNGQVASWSTTTPLPIPSQGLSAWSMNGYIYVVAANVAGTVIYEWYAVVNPNGTLGPWTPGAAPPALIDPLVLNGAGVFTDGIGLSVGPQGQDAAWQSQGNPTSNTGVFVSSNGDGTWDYYGVNVFTPPSTIQTSTIAVTPRISVPLKTTGLTNGTTYHILIQQIGGDVNGYLCMHLDTDSFPGNPTALVSADSAYTWSAMTPTGTCVPFEIYDGAPVTTNQAPLHTWEDNGARITTSVHNTTPDLALIGLLEATSMTTAANANPGFETTLTPWTVTGGTFARSQTQTFEGQWACQITPSGTDANVIVSSELMPCLPGQSVTASTAAWFTSSVTANFSASVNFYTLSGTYISTATNFVSASAATWATFSNPFTAPTNAYQWALHITLQGTPSAGQVFYLDNAIGYPTYMGKQLASVAQINYPVATWPAINPLKPIGLTALA